MDKLFFSKMATYSAAPSAKGNRNVQIKYKKETGHQQRRSNHTYASALGMCVHYLPLISLQIKLSLCMAIEFSLCAKI